MNSSHGIKWRGGDDVFGGGDCWKVHSLSREKQCEFAQNTTDCYSETTHHEYLIILMCNFNSTDTQLVLGTLLLLVLVIFAFMVLGVSADDFFLPNLAALSDRLGLSENVAGVTLLALGNSCSDVLTMIAGISQHGGNLIIGELFGGGLFVACLVTGCVILERPCRVHAGPFMTNALFYCIGLIWFREITLDNYIELWEPVVLIVMYFVYVMLTVLNSYMGWDIDSHQEIYVNSRRSTVAARRRPSAFLVRAPTLTGESFEMVTPLEPESEEGVKLPDPVLPKEQGVRMLAKVDLVIKAERTHLFRELGMNKEAKEEAEGYAPIRGVVIEGEEVYMRPSGLFKELLVQMIPIDVHEWASSSRILKFGMLVSAPVIFLLRLFIPVVNHVALNNGWCKLLNCIHCWSSLVFITYCLGISNYKYPIQLLAYSIALLVGIIFSVIVYYTSSQFEAPCYHIGFAVLGCVCSFALIYWTVNEIIHLLYSMGFVWQISEVMMGLTFLAWGNSLGDAISNITLAKAGFSHMALAACFGGPLAIILIGAGVSFTMFVARSGYARKIYVHSLITHCYFFLIIAVISTCVCIPLCRFEARTSFGMYLIVIFCMYLLLTIIVEFDGAHPLSL